MESSAEIIGRNEDLITQILLRLPVKPLLCLKSVSKHWLSLISSHRFSSLHTLRRHTPAPSALLLPNNSLSQLLSFTSPSPSPFLPLHFLAGLKILHSCNGLLLCSSLPINAQGRTYYVANPATRQLRPLPSLDANANNNISGRVSGISLAFDPSKSSSYRVICVRPVADAVHHFRVQIFDSEAASWRPSGSEFVAPNDMVFDNGVYWNGGIHWISSTGNGIYFDVTKGSIGAMPRVPIAYECGKKRSRYFGESGGHLHLIDIYGLRTTRFNVYEMEKDYSAWRVRYQVDFEDLVNAFPQVVRKFNLNSRNTNNSTYYALTILSVIEEEAAEVGSQLIVRIPGSVVSYDLKSRTFKKACELSASPSKEPLGFGWLHAYQYSPTLASV